MTQLLSPFRDNRRDTATSRPPCSEISRVHASVITDLASLKKTSNFRTRFAVFLVSAYFGLVATLICSRDAVLATLLSCAVVIVVTARLDVVRFRWLAAEIFHEGRLAYAVPPDPHGEDPARDEPVAARNIYVGDLVCTRKDHQEMTRLAEQQPQQWREQGPGRWYRPVLAIGAENGSIKLAVLGYEEPWWENRPEKERYFKRSRPLNPAVDLPWKGKYSAEVATALAGVLDFLSEEEVPEDDVASFVASEYGCSDWAIRNAISVALSAKLAKRRHKPSIVFEIARLFTAPAQLGGHRACKIRLTPAGGLWQQSQSRAARNTWNEHDGQELLAEGRRIAKSLVRPVKAPLVAGISGEEELLAFVREMVGRFRHWVEHQGGWKVLWLDKPGDGRIMPETMMQLIFFGVLSEHFKNAGLWLDREVETGRGPVDFTVTGARGARVLIEMKKLSHTDFCQGLRDQTPVYMRGQEVNHAVFLAIRDSDTPAARKRWETLREEAAAVRAETGLDIEVERIDMLPKPSASKA